MKRIQRKRTKGWRAPDGAIYVGRPTKWGNPHAWHEMTLYSEAEARQIVVDLYRDWLTSGPGQSLPLEELQGHDLMCWCPLDQPCHADVLIEAVEALP